MPLAISLIVNGYVHLNDRNALETLRAHRAGLLDSARSIAGMDTGLMMATLTEEIAIIDAGLSQLDAWSEQQAHAPGRPRYPSPSSHQ
jgi:hypothetical protein